MFSLKEELFKHKDEEYRKFCINLTPGVDPNSFIGVRVPIIREICKSIKDKDYIDCFLNSLPHKYYEENIAHSILLSKEKDIDKCLYLIDLFQPYINNWAVSDTLKPICFKKNLDKALSQIKIWLKSDLTYRVRTAIDFIMTFYLEEGFKEEILELVSNVSSDEYYIKMMQAWFFATALSKRFKETIPYIINNKLSIWVHNKTIQKAIESYRITSEEKELLRKYKR